MGNKDKTRDETAATSSMDESRDTALARTIALAVAEAFAKQKAEETKLITETFTRQMEKTQAQYQELLKASRAQNFPSTLKVSSGSQGFRVMDPFDWTLDKKHLPEMAAMVHEGQEGFGGHGGRYREDQDLLPAPLARWQGY